MRSDRPALWRRPLLVVIRSRGSWARAYARRQLRLARHPEPAFLPGFMEVVETGIRNVHALQSRLWKVKQLCHQLVQHAATPE